MAQPSSSTAYSWTSICQSSCFRPALSEMQLSARMNGDEAAAAIRAAGIQTPIIALSGSMAFCLFSVQGWTLARAGNVMNDEVRRCLDAGCNEFLSKVTLAGVAHSLLKFGFVTACQTPEARSCAEEVLLAGACCSKHCCRNRRRSLMNAAVAFRYRILCLPCARLDYFYSCFNGPCALMLLRC